MLSIQFKRVAGNAHLCGPAINFYEKCGLVTGKIILETRCFMCVYKVNAVIFAHAESKDSLRLEYSPEEYGLYIWN